MLGFFGDRRHKAAENPAITPVQSSSARPRQERSYSNYVESGSTHRPDPPPRSNTWHTSKTSEPSPKLHKLKRRNGFSKWFFKESKSPDNEDDGIWCRGVENTDMLGEKGDSSSRGNASRQPTYVNALNPVPASINSQPKAGQVQRRGSTRGSRPTDKQRIPSKRSRSEGSFASGTTTSSVTPPTDTKSPYTKSSATSFTNPRSASSVPRQKQIENSGALSDPEEYCRGRDFRNSRRGERNAKVKSPDDSINFSSSDRSDEKRKPSRHRDDSYNRSDHSSSRNENKPSSKRKENLNSSAQKAKDKNGYATRVPFDDRKPHFYNDKVNMNPPKKHRRGYER